MIISIETPVFKGGWLEQCIESVLAQTSSDWMFSLLWDGGDELSKSILEKIKKMNHPRITVYFQENRGIAHSRHFLSEHSEGEFILTLDDDDILAPDAVEKFIAAVEKMPWAGIIRARRGFIDEEGNSIDTQDWFPFKSRKYSHGMTQDLYNHSQPTIIRRSDYERTSGWEGFEEYHYAGADCDIYTRIEEISEIELLDECLYYYRLNPERTSNRIGNSAADDMWRRIADRTIKRRGLPIKRVNDIQPFEFVRIHTPASSKEMVDVVIPFWESNEEEIPYEFNRPSQLTYGDVFRFDGTSSPVNGNKVYGQILDPLVSPFDRLEIVCSSTGPVRGVLEAAFYTNHGSTSPVALAKHRFKDAAFLTKFLSMRLEREDAGNIPYCRMEISFLPDSGNCNNPILHVWKKNSESMGNGNNPNLWMRMLKDSPDYCRKRLDICLRSLKEAGISGDSIYVIEKRQSSAANRNEGVRLSSKPLICFLDDDVEIMSPDLFTVLLERLNSLDVGLVGPKIVTDQGLIYCADPYFNEESMPNPRGLGEYDKGQYDYSSIVPWLPSTVLLTKREVYLSVGGFDENYIGSQHEDVDFCLRARSRGFQCCYTGEVVVKHFNCSRNNNHSANYGYFKRRWEKYEHLFDSSCMKRISD